MLMPSASAADRPAPATSSLNSPASASMMMRPVLRAPGTGSVLSLMPRSSSVTRSRSEASTSAALAALSSVDAPTPSRIVFTRPGRSRSSCNRSSDTKTARARPCCCRTENSPSSSADTTARIDSRTVRPTSPLRPCNEPTGIADGFSTRTSRASPACPPSSRASPSLRSTSFLSGARPDGSRP